MKSNNLIDMARVKLAADRVRAYLAARASSRASSDIIGIHAENACILSGADLQLILAALPTVPETESAVLEQALTRLAARQPVKRSGTVSWGALPCL